MPKSRLWSRLRSCLLMGALFATGAGAEPPPDPSALKLASVAAAVAPAAEGEPLFSKRGDWVLPIASLTKLMTALVVLESEADMDQWLTVEERHFPPAANAFSRLRPGSQARRRDLLHIAVMSSENYAAYLLARHHPGGYDAFVQAMNDKAEALGMSRSRFVDSSGLSEENVSTANDLLKLVRATYADETLRAMSAAGRHTVRFRNPGYSLYFGNTNPLVHSGRWQVGLTKTGYLDAAGRCLVMVAEVEGEPTAMVLLNSFGTRTPLGDVGRVRRWLNTGSSGSVAGAALRYERETAEALRQPMAEAGPVPASGD